jgi:hypothetical protein
MYKTPLDTYFTTHQTQKHFLVSWQPCLIHHQNIRMFLGLSPSIKHKNCFSISRDFYLPKYKVFFHLVSWSPTHSPIETWVMFLRLSPFTTYQTQSVSWLLGVSTYEIQKSISQLIKEKKTCSIKLLSFYCIKSWIGNCKVVVNS